MRDSRARVAFYPEANTAVLYHDGLVLTCMGPDQLWRALTKLSSAEGRQRLQAKIGASNVADAELVEAWLQSNEPTRPRREQAKRAKATLDSITLTDLDLEGLDA